MNIINILHHFNGHDYRIQHLIDTLKIDNRVNYIGNIDDISCGVDVILLEFDDTIIISQYTIDKLLKFKGKLLFYTVDDGCSIQPNRLPPELISRIDGWITYFKRSELPDCILDKTILIPRYTIPYTDTTNIQYDSKINKIVFIGRTTGNYWLNGKNWRIECLNRIYSNRFLRDRFDGWIVDDSIIDVSTQYSAYNNTFKFVQKNNFMSEYDWINKLKSNTLSLCIPGHTKFGYRHPQSMATMATMIGNFDLTNDPYPFMFSDKLVNMSYTIKPDLSDLECIFEYALKTPEKTK